MLGRDTLTAQEIHQMLLQENVVVAYRERQKATSWPAWVKDNPDKADLLAWASGSDIEQGEEAS